LLRRSIALRNRAGFQILVVSWAIAPQIAKICAEVRQIIVVGGYFLILPANFLELFNFVEGNLGDGRFPFETGIPGAPSAAVEPASIGCGVSERRVHDLTVSDTVKELMYADVREQSLLPKQSDVGGPVQFNEFLDLLFLVAELAEDSPFGAELRWDEPMGARE